LTKRFKKNKLDGFGCEFEVEIDLSSSKKELIRFAI
jgi:hypothetical protein